MSDNSKTDFGFEQVSPDEKTRRVGEVFDSVAGRYDLMNDLMSLGLHRVWKMFAVARAALRPGFQVLDLAGGTGDLTRIMAKQVGDTGSVVLSDINAHMLDVGRDRIIDAGVSDRVRIVQSNAEALPFAEHAFDIVTIAFGLRNVTNKGAALREMYRVLKPGARALILEFSKLQLNGLKKAYDVYSFGVLPRIGQIVAKDGDSYRYLAESIRRHPDQQTLVAEMQAAGFERCRFDNFAGGIVAMHEGTRL